MSQISNILNQVAHQAIVPNLAKTAGMKTFWLIFIMVALSSAILCMCLKHYIIGGILFGIALGTPIGFQHALDTNIPHINQQIETKAKSQLQPIIKDIAKDRPYTQIVNQDGNTYICFTKTTDKKNLKADITITYQTTNLDPEIKRIDHVSPTNSGAILNPKSTKLYQTEDATKTLISFAIDHAHSNHISDVINDEVPNQ